MSPIVIGIKINEGVLNHGMHIYEGEKYLGKITSITINNIEIQSAQTGDYVCISIESSDHIKPIYKFMNLLLLATCEEVHS